MMILLQQKKKARGEDKNREFSSICSKKIAEFGFIQTLPTKI
jgi:hypothetical protein